MAQVYVDPTSFFALKAASYIRLAALNVLQI